MEKKVGQCQDELMEKKVGQCQDELIFYGEMTHQVLQPSFWYRHTLSEQLNMKWFQMI